MNYDTIIVEMLLRIQNLEIQVKEMAEMMNCGSDGSANPQPKAKKVTTANIREYIEQLKKNAIASGEECLTIAANDIHKGMQLKSRFPMVCNAMRQCMADNDEIIHDTPSGYSSTLEIKYYLNG